MKPELLFWMLVWGCSLWSAGLVNAAPQNGFPPADSGYVTDVAILLTVDEEEQIEQRLFRVEKNTGIEIAVVTIGSIRDYPDTPNGSVEDFARGLFDHYGVGNMPDNKGILLLVARNDRKARIELGAGYGNRRDQDAARITDKVIVPYFKKDRYGAGIQNGTEAICAEFTGSGMIGRNLLQGLYWLVGMAAVGLIVWSLLKNGTRGWGWVIAGMLLVIGLVIVRILMTAIRQRRTEFGDSGGWSPGGFGGGFGGGFSGGGGATGSW